ncbi:hypothetical protein PHJA_000699400 [Phtheirospermum japonicum]|uniref:Retrotransposon Copia-like N-terminal domain-containing protein n=1 Tax=Phtheirospermum japonicum TaxID=374723 RepID=A0A830BEJ2_9LAMI|nr:hypothetical protein PHJA_000699400 [Phtheirospermum japonicum]
MTESAPTTPLVPIAVHHHLPIKLTQTNYSSWRAHLIALLTSHDLLGYINGSFKKSSLLPDGSNATAVSHWVPQDNLLLAAIFSSLSQDILPFVSSASWSSETWDILTRLCAGHSRTRVNQLKSELYRVEIKDCLITQYLHYVKAKANELDLIDEPMNIDDLTLFVINGLVPEYATIVGQSVLGRLLCGTRDYTTSSLPMNKRSSRRRLLSANFWTLPMQRPTTARMIRDEV